MAENPNFSIVNVEEELGRSYVNYAMSVIIARALPDMRDGLKPVQRRILYAMRVLNITADSGHVKCAKVCGQTSGDYHPHGEAVIYPTLVRMAQHWSMRYPLIDGQGNFGSVDGDSPAAMRYTEARLTPLAMEMLEDLDRETVEWIPNYSQTLNEPTVLPGKFPNILCNGSQGIAVGMATNLPPHNLTEVCNAILLRIANPECTLDEAMEVIPGPDFPTYGTIMGTKGIRSAYETGRGSIVMQAKTMIEQGDAGKSVIVVTEIPYQVNKETLIKAIAVIIKDHKFDGILSVQDYSDKRGMRIEIEVRRDVNPNKALNYLLKHTSLRTTFGAIMLSLVEGAPRTAPLLYILDEYIRHRREIVERRTKYEVFRALEEVHLNEGYQIARRFLDDIITVIRNSENAASARAELVRRFDFSVYQANAVLNMPLRNLTRLNQRELEDRYKDSLLKVQNLMDILNSASRLTKVITDETTALRDKHGDERRSRIQAREAGDFTAEDLIPDEEAIISISRDGYIKRVSIDAYRAQKRGGKGVNNTLKADDEPAHLFQVSTHHTILFFTDRGRVYKLKAYEIPESGRYAKGMPVINYINIVGGERVTATVSVKDMTTEGFLTMVTRGTGTKRFFYTADGEEFTAVDLESATAKAGGKEIAREDESKAHRNVSEIKRTPLSAFSNIRNNGLIAFDIEEGDELGWALKSRGTDDIILVTREGQSIRFHEKDATSRSRAAGGVKAITFRDGKPNDQVVTAAVVDDGCTLLVVSENGYGKRTPLDDYRVQGRGGSGILTMNVTDKTGEIIGAEMVEADDRLLIMTTKGKGIRLRIKEIRTTGRVAQGVKLINLSGNDHIRSIARIIKSTDDGDLEEGEESTEESAEGEEQETGSAEE